MSRTLTEEQREDLAQLMIMMKIPKESCLEVLTVIDTPMKMRLFLDKLSEKNFRMTSEEVYQALVETVEETT